ncbi:uncharacterized protein BDW43DRAFT_142654 [Aspergillus alliaceus]|uniref:uncharacterized protein n=1 Tax=Petromyces alliaceus TaxID=209559 RepID=UPI0012A59270|nr:uncharacterized protein BDW43DRAFT_142654 [Aspergillus alliaceus]KAB8231218.1 hypothetical protein BDW43DRAFT_142654 [Aspergillus alliaceus]
MGDVLGVIGLVLPPVINLLKKGHRSIKDMEELLKDESDTAKLVDGLKQLLDEFNGATFTTNIRKMDKELYLLLEKRCQKLYDTIRDVQDQFRGGWASRAFACTKSQKELKKLRSEFDSVIKMINNFESTSNFMQRLRGEDLNNHTIDEARLSKTIITAISRELTKRIPHQPNDYRGYQREKVYRVQKAGAGRSQKGPYQARTKIEKCIKVRQEEGECRNCGTTEHREKYCANRCVKCNQGDHTVSGCYNDVRCYDCGRWGHMRNDNTCPQRYRQRSRWN